MYRIARFLLRPPLKVSKSKPTVRCYILITVSASKMSVHSLLYTVSSYRMLWELAWIQILWDQGFGLWQCSTQHLAKQEPRATRQSWHQQRAPSEISHDSEPAVPCPSMSPRLENQERTVMMDTCRSSSLSEEFIHCGLCVFGNTAMFLDRGPQGVRSDMSAKHGTAAKWGSAEEQGEQRP